MLLSFSKRKLWRNMIHCSENAEGQGCSEDRRKVWNVSLIIDGSTMVAATKTAESWFVSNCVRHKMSVTDFCFCLLMTCLLRLFLLYIPTWNNGAEWHSASATWLNLQSSSLRRDTSISIEGIQEIYFAVQCDCVGQCQTHRDNNSEQRSRAVQRICISAVISGFSRRTVQVWIRRLSQGHCDGTPACWCARLLPSRLNP